MCFRFLLSELIRIELTSRFLPLFNFALGNSPFTALMIGKAERKRVSRKNIFNFGIIENAVRMAFASSECMAHGRVAARTSGDGASAPRRRRGNYFMFYCGISHTFTRLFAFPMKHFPFNCRTKSLDSFLPPLRPRCFLPADGERRRDEERRNCERN